MQKLPFNLYMKKSAFAFQEVAALRLVRPHVTIPVPFVLDVVGEYFIMTGVRGKPLGTVFSEMQPAKVDRVRGSLSEFVHQLRAIQNDTLLPAVLCRALTTRCRAATSTVWTGSNSVLSPPLLPFTRICFQVFPRSNGKRLRKLLRQFMRNFTPSTLRTKA